MKPLLVTDVDGMAGKPPSGEPWLGRTCSTFVTIVLRDEPARSVGVERTRSGHAADGLRAAGWVVRPADRSPVRGARGAIEWLRNARRE
jgi:hypothetical protein